MVLKIGPNWPIRPVELSTGELSIWSISMNRFVIKPALNRLNQRLNRWTIEPNKPSNFLQTSHTLILQIFVYYLRGPLSTKPILRLMLSKLKLIISSSLVQATRPSPMTRKLITLLFGLCLQAQFAGMFGLSITLLFGSCLQAQFADMFDLQGMLQSIYRTLRHRIHVLPMWDWEWN